MKVSFHNWGWCNYTNYNNEEGGGLVTMVVAEEKKNDNYFKVLLVDDSAVIRGFLRRFLEVSPDIKVVATADNGELAVREVKRQQFDVVVLDIEMPVMDGLTALPFILEADPSVHVIMASTLTQKNASVTFKALELGATECLAKPSSTRDMLDTESFKRDLIEKTKELGNLTRKARTASNNKIANTNKRYNVENKQSDVAVAAAISNSNKQYSLKPLPTLFKPKVLAIGSSTGGPQALMNVFSSLKGTKPNIPIVITQHMPEKFTTILAQNLAKYSDLPCFEAEDEQEVKAGEVYVAPGNYHMTFTKSITGAITVKLNQEAPENFCRPSVEPMIRSLMNVYGASNILALILTGMGQDGVHSCRQLADAGGVVFAQNKETSVVWGMPAAVANAGICSKLLPIDTIGDELKLYLNVI